MVELVVSCEPKIVYRGAKLFVEATVTNRNLAHSPAHLTVEILNSDGSPHLRSRLAKIDVADRHYQTMIRISEEISPGNYHVAVCAPGEEAASLTPISVLDESSVKRIDKMRQAFSLRAEASKAHDDGRTSEALSFLRSAISFYEEAGSIDAASQAWMDLAELQGRDSQYDQAIVSGRKALHLLRESHDELSITAFERRLRAIEEQLIQWLSSRNRQLREQVAFSGTSALTPVMSGPLPHDPSIMDRVKIFISYASRDRNRLDKLRIFLDPLLNNGTAGVWFEREIHPGTNWRTECAKSVEAADLFVLLVTADLIESRYLESFEMSMAQDRSRRDARVLPVIVDYCDWQSTWIGHLPCVPEDRQPIISSRPHSKGWLQAVDGIRRIVDERKSTVENPRWAVAGRGLKKAVEFTASRMPVIRCTKAHRSLIHDVRSIR